MKKVPAEVMDKFYGCGAPLPLGIDGLNVLDLGSGSGRDAYGCAGLVGEQGQVIGLDMTKEQIQVCHRSSNSPRPLSDLVLVQKLTLAAKIQHSPCFHRSHRGMPTPTARPLVIASQICALLKAT